MVDLFHRRGVLVVGIEQDRHEPELDRVYVGARYEWVYVLTDHGTVQMGPMHTTTILSEEVELYVDRLAKSAEWWNLRASDGKLWDEHL